MKRRPTRPASWLKALSAFPQSARSELDALWDNGGVLPADAVARVGAESRLDTGAVMIRLLPLAQAYAVVPVSHYPVGCVAAGLPEKRGATPSLYFGANLEIAGVALSFTVHAEQSATNNAWLHGERGLSALAVTAAPCGYCRQFLYELSSAGALSLLLPATNKAGYAIAPLAKFLPQAFGPQDLGVRGGLLASEPVRLQSAGKPQDELAALAWRAAENSYAPYPTDRVGQFSGVALELKSGRLVEGRYAGNAAYNPSLSPLESALAFARMNSALEDKLDVRRCALVEVPTLASQRSATEAVLAAIAPRVRLEYHAARMKA
jgi:cytidine deaminase